MASVTISLQTRCFLVPYDIGISIVTARTIYLGTGSYFSVVLSRAAQKNNQEDI